MYMYNVHVHVGEQNNESDKSHYNDYTCVYTVQCTCILYMYTMYTMYMYMYMYIVYMLNVTKCAKRDFTHKKSLTVAILPFITGSQ